MEGLTQLEFEHSAASELSGPRVDPQHIKSCPLAGFIGGAQLSYAQDLAEPHSCGGRLRKRKCP